jgi:PncC family amidohydrolase
MANGKIFNTANQLVTLCKQKSIIITTAESCTGGMLAQAITSIVGASEVFASGYVTYSEEAKVKMLGVAAATIKNYGVVSYEVALEMAQKVMAKAQATAALAITGFAGPGGGNEQNPCGTVYIGFGYHDHFEVERNVFNGNREEVRQAATIRACELLINIINQDASL